MLRCSWRCVSNRPVFVGFGALRGALRENQSLICIQGLALSRDGAEPETLPLNRERGVKSEGTIVSGMAGRYATALFELARDQHVIDAVKADLERFEGLLSESPDLTRLVRSPVFSADQQGKALTAVLERAGIGGLSAKFLQVLARNRRLFAVRGVIKDFRTLVARHKGEVTADVTLAEPPDERQLSAIKDALRAVTGKDVQVDVKVDPSIIGGLIVKVGSRMIDSSLRTKLNNLKVVMKGIG
jgi:F-type H+-transporting ATPase subunit delta